MTKQIDQIARDLGYHMGNGWLYQLARAIERGDAARTAELERDIGALISGRCFDILPYPAG